LDASFPWGNNRVMIDIFGLGISTGSSAAAEAFNDGLRRYLQQQAGAIEAFSVALLHDAEFGLARLGLGLGLRAEAQIKAGNDEIAAAPGLRLDKREASLVNAVALQVSLQFDIAEESLQRHLTFWPNDALALSLRLALLNVFSSRPDRDVEMLRAVTSVQPAFADDPYPLAALAFALQENRRFAEAHDVATEAVRLMPNNARSAHAAAHTFFETGSFDEGERFLETWLDEWENPGGFACHLGWHSALSALSRADRGAARVRLDGLLSFVGRSLAALADCASLSWRLALDGDSDDLPWEALSEIPDLPGNRFGNAHRAMVLAGLHDVDGLRRYEDILAELGGLNRLSAQWARSLRLMSTGRPVEAADVLDSLSPDFRTLGGSQAQTDVFRETHIAVLLRAGRTFQARRMIEDRLRQRFSQRDEVWLADTM
jgi:tetratricopeptide (TPR) repeat protein